MTVPFASKTVPALMQVLVIGSLAGFSVANNCLEEASPISFQTAKNLYTRFAVRRRCEHAKAR